MIDRARRAACAAAGILALAAGPAGAAAGGLFVPGYGSQAQPRAGAFVAKSDDPSATYWNPAGLAKQHGTTVHVGVNFTGFSLDYQRTGEYEVPEMGGDHSYTGDPYPKMTDQSHPALGIGRYQAIPLISVVTDLGGATPLVFGIGIGADNGFPQRDLGSGYQFQDPDNPPPPTRYDVVTQEITAAFPSLAVAYEITPQLDVGARFSWGIASTKGTSYLWGLINYSEDVRSDGVFHIEAKDNFVPSAGLGVLYRPSPALELGASYRSEESFHFKGTGQATLGSNLNVLGMQDYIAPELDQPQCAGGGTIAALKACLDLTLPQAASVGGRLVARDESGAEKGDIELDVQWEDWSGSSNYRVVVDGKSGLTGLQLQPTLIRHGFRDTYSVRLGGSWSWAVGGHRLEARGGAAYDTAAAPVSWTRADIDGMARTTLGAGLAYQLGRTRIEAGGGVSLEGSRDVSECNPSQGAVGCDGSGMETPQGDRTAPDPAQPLQGENNQTESPFNAGHYQQGYVLFSAGVTYAF